MKKLWHVFWILTALGAGALAGSAVALPCNFGAFLAAAGAFVWLVMFFHFRSVEYSVENDRILIRGGVLIKRERALPVQSVLWKTTVKLGSVALFTVLHTASGRVAVFALFRIPPQNEI